MADGYFRMVTPASPYALLRHRFCLLQAMDIQFDVHGFVEELAATVAAAAEVFLAGDGSGDAEKH